ncbi:unnamed protein product [Vitrella brassicaformis CCMP3155]|uniref:Glycoside hydrolase 35 catalytic domain-containing protein n=3 Tax=Vitrella brassicaformis TaxID=1169539 RepID=A0A0G4GZD0_VITBC|nr:unnamed protein product [Vitrella brassicaformis CCMP3155]|eukprot:CEM36599.1 unnamed protein product [Vitrella brassicaformis CCMP3155]
MMNEAPGSRSMLSLPGFALLLVTLVAAQQPVIRPHLPGLRSAHSSSPSGCSRPSPTLVRYKARVNHTDGHSGGYAVNVSAASPYVSIGGVRTLLIGATVEYAGVSEGEVEKALEAAKGMGSNVVQTRVYWGYHQPWNGTQTLHTSRLAHFLRVAASFSLYVILHIGPDFSPISDRTFGGMPLWLQYVRPALRFHSFSLPWVHRLERWVRELTAIVRDDSAKHGGPIVMMRLSHIRGCATAKRDYVKWLASLPARHGKDLGVIWALDWPLHCERSGHAKTLFGNKSRFGPYVPSCVGRYCGGPGAPYPGSHHGVTGDWLQDVCIKRGTPCLWLDQWPTDDGLEYSGEDRAFASMRFVARGGAAVIYDTHTLVDEYTEPTEAYSHAAYLHYTLEWILLDSLPPPPTLISKYMPSIARHLQQQHLEASNNGTTRKGGAHASVRGRVLYGGRGYGIGWEWGDTHGVLCNHHATSPVRVWWRKCRYSILPWSCLLVKNSDPTALYATTDPLPSSPPAILPSPYQDALAPTHLLPEQVIPPGDVRTIGVKVPRVCEDGQCCEGGGRAGLRAGGMIDQIAVTRGKTDYLWYVTYLPVRQWLSPKARIMQIDLPLTNQFSHMHIFTNTSLLLTTPPLAAPIRKRRTANGTNEPFVQLSVAIPASTRHLAFLSVVHSIEPPVAYHTSSGRAPRIHRTGLGGGKVRVDGRKVADWWHFAGLHGGRGGGGGEGSAMVWSHYSFHVPHTPNVMNGRYFLRVNGTFVGQVWCSDRLIGHHGSITAISSPYENSQDVSPDDESDEQQRQHEELQELHEMKIPPDWLARGMNYVTVLVEHGSPPSVSLVHQPLARTRHQTEKQREMEALMQVREVRVRERGSASRFIHRLSGELAVESILALQLMGFVIFVGTVCCLKGCFDSCIDEEACASEPATPHDEYTSATTAEDHVGPLPGIPPAHPQQHQPHKRLHRRSATDESDLQPLLTHGMQTPAEASAHDSHAPTRARVTPAISQQSHPHTAPGRPQHSLFFDQGGDFLFAAEGMTQTVRVFPEHGHGQPRGR